MDTNIYLVENNFCLKPNLLLLSVYKYTHTHTQTYIIMYIGVYIRICILMARSFKSRQNVFLVLSTSQLYHTDGFLWKEGYT